MKSNLSIMLLCLTSGVCHATSTATSKVLTTLSSQVREQHFQFIKDAYHHRWAEFNKNYTSTPWRKNKPREAVLAEYSRLNAYREQLWYEDPRAPCLVATSDYPVAQELLAARRYRVAKNITFEHSKTDNSYNASSIVIDNLRFIALEGPADHNLENFNNLLVNHHVTKLVRLSPPRENNGEYITPYWRGKLKTHQATLHIGIPQSRCSTDQTYDIPYFYVNDWLDDTGSTAEKVLDLVLKTMRVDTHHAQDLIACHCASGVGRTGTFIAAYSLVDNIRRQIASGTQVKDLDLSIDELVGQLSIQRPYMVGTAEQYLSLHRIADLYVDSLVQLSLQ